jgi:hypothetical protein
VHEKSFPFFEKHPVSRRDIRYGRQSRAPPVLHNARAAAVASALLPLLRKSVVCSCPHMKNGMLKQSGRTGQA